MELDGYLVPSSPWPKPIALGYGGGLAGSVIRGGRWGGGEGEGGRLAARVGWVVLVVNLVVGLAVGAGGASEVLEDKCVTHGFGGV